MGYGADAGLGPIPVDRGSDADAVVVDARLHLDPQAHDQPILGFFHIPQVRDKEVSYSCR